MYFPKQQRWGLEIVRLTSSQKPTILIHFNLLQVFPSMITFVKFAVLVIPSLNVLSAYSYVSLNLISVSTVRVLIKFVTQLL